MSVQRKFVTPEQIERAKALMARGHSIKTAAPMVGATVYVLNCALDPTYRARRKGTVIRRRQRMSLGIHEPRKTTNFRVEYGETSGVYVKIQNVPDYVLADRDRRAAIQPQTPSQLLLGDPIPGTGRSALDRKRENA